MLLENKTAVVYGAGGAVGGAVARAFGREGARVFLAGRTLSALDAVAADIVAAGGTADVAQLDALDADAVEHHAAMVVQQAGALDISFNAVQIDDVQLGTPIVEMAVDSFVPSVAQAVQTQLVTARAAARHMAPRGAGVILTITSSHAREAVPNFGSTGVTQAAIEGLFRQLAGELGPQGIRTVVLRSSGSPDAPSMEPVGDMIAETSGMPREAMEAAATAGPALRRFPMLAEVGNVAVLMACDLASPITGAVANVTCGGVMD